MVMLYPAGRLDAYRAEQTEGPWMSFASPIGKLFATRARAATLVVVVVAAVSVAYASIPDSAGVIHGCYNKPMGNSV